MWTIYEGKLVTTKYDGSNPAKDKENFPNLIKWMGEVLTAIKNNPDKDLFRIENGCLELSADGHDSWITISPDGVISVCESAA